MNINENFLTIRDELKKLSADAILCPMDCSFDNVEVPYSDLYYVSGFTGSNGRAIISKNDAFISVDGRYTKQVLEQVDTKFWNIEHFLNRIIYNWIVVLDIRTQAQFFKRSPNV